MTTPRFSFGEPPGLVGLCTRLKMAWSSALRFSIANAQRRGRPGAPDAGYAELGLVLVQIFFRTFRHDSLHSS